MATTVKFWQDDGGFNPRTDYDNMGHMVYAHRRYSLGDERLSADEIQERIASLPKGSIVLPLYLYDHSGITMSTGSFSCPWDSGQVGWIYATPEKIREAYMVKKATAKHREKAKAVLEGEVRTFDAYIRGDVWGFTIADEGGKIAESCGGFICTGTADEALANMLECIPAEHHEAAKAAWEQRF